MTTEEKNVALLEEIVGKLSSTARANKKKGAQDLKDFVATLKERGELSTIAQKTWRRLIEYLLDFVRSETKAQKALKRQTLKKDVSEPFRSVLSGLINADEDDNIEISSANHFLDRTTAKGIFEFVIEGMQDEDIRQHHLIEMMDILKKMLGVRFYIIKLEPDAFKKLFEQLANCLLQETELNLGATEVQQLASALEALMFKYPRDIRRYKKAIFQLFTAFFTDLSKEKYERHAVLLHVFRSLNYFLSQSAQDSFFSARTIANALTKTFEDMWRSSRSNETLKVEICKFYNIIFKLKLHDKDIPVEDIGSLYSLVRDSLSNPKLFSFRTKTMSETQKAEQRKRRNIFFSFAAETIFLANSAPNAKKELTEEEPSAKKRRRLTPTEELLSKISFQTSAEELESWLNVLLELLQMHPPFAVLVLDVCHACKDILEKSKTPLVQQYSLACLNVLLPRLKESKGAFLAQELWPLLCRLLSTESDDIINDVFAVMETYICQIDITAGQTVLQLVFDSKYVTESRYCSSQLLSLLTTISHLSHDKESKITLKREELLKYLVEQLKFNPLISTTPVFFIDSVLNVIADISEPKSVSTKPIESFLGGDYRRDKKFSAGVKFLSTLSCPLYEKAEPTASRRQIVSVDNASCMILLTLLQEYMTSLTTLSTTASPEKKKRDPRELLAEHLSTVILFHQLLLAMYSVAWRSESRVATSLEQLIKSSIGYIVKQTEELKNAAKPWILVLKALQHILQCASLVPKGSALAMDKGYTTAWKQLADSIILLLQQNMEAQSQDSENNSQTSNASFFSQSQNDDMVFEETGEASRVVKPRNEVKDSKNRMVISTGLVSIAMIVNHFPSLASAFIAAADDLFAKAEGLTVKLELADALGEINNQDSRDKALENIKSILIDYPGDDYSRTHCLQRLSKIMKPGRVSAQAMFEVKTILDAIAELLKKESSVLTPNETTRLAFVECIYASMTNDSLFNDLVGTFISYVKYPSYKIRIFLAHSIGGLLSVDPSVLPDLTNELNALLESAADDGLTVRTSLVSIANIAISITASLQRTLFTLLCNYIDPEFPERDFIVPILQYLAQKLKYANFENMLVDNIRYILYEWCMSKNLQIQDIPFKLFGSDTFSSFIEEYGGFLLPFLCEKNDPKAIESVGSLIGIRTVEDTLLKFFDVIYAYTMLLLVAEEAKGKVAQEFLRTKIGTKLPNLLKMEADNVIIEMLMLSSDDPNNVNRPFFSLNVVSQGLKNFSQQQLGFADVTLMLKDTKSRIHQILLCLYEQIELSVTSQRRKSMFHVLSFFVNLLGDLVLLTSVIRSVVHIVLQSSYKQEIQEVACALLIKICERAFKGKPEHISDFGKHLKSIVSAMIAQLKPEQTESTAMFKLSPQYTVLKKLVIESPKPSFNSFLLELEAFPQKAAFMELENELQQLRGKQSLMNEIQIFLNHRILSSEVTGLSPLCRLIKERKSEIAAAVHDKKASALITRLVSRLISICTSQYSQMIKNEAAECIAELGLMAPSVQDDESLTGMRKEYEFDNVSHRVINWSPEAFMSIARVSVLEILNTFLTDTDVAVVRQTADTLQVILSTALGKRAYAELNPETQLMLQPYVIRSNKSRYAKTFKAPKELLTASPFSDTIFDTKSKNHVDWVKTVTFTLLHIMEMSDEVLKLCGDLCLLKPSFAEHIFPLAVFNISQNAPSTVGEAGVCEKLSRLCDKHILSSEHSKPRTIRLFLSALNLLFRNKREQYKLGPAKKKESHYWMNINPLTVAHAAFRAEAYFSALMYSELFCEKDNLLIPLNTAELSFEDNLPQNQKILVEVYSKIEEPDGIYGINRSYGTRSQLLKTLHERDWEKAAGAYDSLLQYYNPQLPSTGFDIARDEQSLHSGLLDCLQNLGYSNTSRLYFQGMNPNLLNSSEEIQEKFYEKGWRTLAWKVAEPQAPPSVRVGFHQALYRSLKALEVGDAKEFETYYHSTRQRLVKTLGSSLNMYQATLSKLQQLSDVMDMWKLRWGLDSLNASDESSPSTKTRVPTVPAIEKLLWTQKGFLEEYSFDTIEPVMMLRSVLLQISGLSEASNQQIVDLVALARKENRLQLASTLTRSIYHKEQLKQSGNVPNWLHEEAKILWQQGETESAINTAKLLAQLLLKQIGQKQKLPENYRMLGSVYTTIGRWLTQTRSEGASEVINTYLNDATKHSKNQSKAFYTLAQYLDTLYVNINRKLKSPEYLISQQLQKHNEVLLNDYAKHLAQNAKKESPMLKEMKRTQYFLKQVVENHSNEHKKLQTESSHYMKQAMLNYGFALRHGAKYDIPAVFRVCSIWFNNSTDLMVNQTFYDLFKKGYIASHKFLPLIYQIASRLGAESAFTQVTRELLILVASEHPYHSLHQIFALAFGDQVEGTTPVAAASRRKTEDTTGYVVDKDKIAAAKTVIETIKRKQDKVLASAVAQIELLITAYKELAFIDLTEGVQKSFNNEKLSPNLLICKLANLNLAPVATAELEVRPDKQYVGTFPSVVSFEKTFSTAGGINLPKIVKCNGSNGIQYRQLVKGKDDLRQDAVMQQLFRLVNMLLTENKESRKRALRVRTYPVIPLTPTTGVLGWVENTMPLAEYLIGNTKNLLSGAHPRYRPADALSQDCRKKMEELQNPKRKTRATDEEKLEGYLQICKQFQPVFHHFFLEMFPNPSDWFSKRLTYTRSVATNSIVGYAIGLGDRHSHNILIDLKSAEHVHIDLGVAFEQGKFLPTPERVPFRLTRDIVDGFGISGTEGVFRRCCEITMQVLRNNMELLGTVVEVFIHDPLYRWNMSHTKALKMQRGYTPVQNTNDEVQLVASASVSATKVQVGQTVEVKNQDAERALFRLREKLQGYEEGEILSVKGQVNKLITQAQDPSLLSRMFYGWASWV